MIFFVICNNTYLFKFTKLLVNLTIGKGHYLADNKNNINFAAALWPIRFGAKCRRPLESLGN